MSFRTHKIALNPNPNQKHWFSSQCGYARFAYNQALDDFKTGLKDDNFQSWQTLNTSFNKSKKDYDWTGSQDQRAALYGIQNLGQAISEGINQIMMQELARYPQNKCKNDNC